MEQQIKKPEEKKPVIDKAKIKELDDCKKKALQNNETIKKDEKPNS